MYHNELIFKISQKILRVLCRFFYSIIEIVVYAKKVFIMKQFIFQSLDHIPLFIGTMDKVVIIWGMFSFIHQLNLQNATAVADRALGRLPELKNGIRSLQGCVQDTDTDLIKNIQDMYKKLFIDLQQLDIATKYYTIKNRIEMLLKDELVCHQVIDNSKIDMTDVQLKFEQNKENTILFIDELEDELMKIYSISHQSFLHTLSKSFVRVTWISLVVYLISRHLYVGAISLFFVGCGIIFALRLQEKMADK